MEELQEHDMEKWGNVQVFKLYPDILKGSEALYQKCQVAELAKIAKVLESYTQRSFFSHQFVKAKNVNIICKAFKGSNFLQEQQETKNRMMHTPRSIMQLSKCVLMSTMYITICLQVSYAKVVHMLEKVKWQNHSKIPLLATIPRNLVCQPPKKCIYFAILSTTAVESKWSPVSWTIHTYLPTCICISARQDKTSAKWNTTLDFVTTDQTS